MCRYFSASLCFLTERKDDSNADSGHYSRSHSYLTVIYPVYKSGIGPCGIPYCLAQPMAPLRQLLTVFSPCCFIFFYDLPIYFNKLLVAPLWFSGLRRKPSFSNVRNVSLHTWKIKTSLTYSFLPWHYFCIYLSKLHWGGILPALSVV